MLMCQSHQGNPARRPFSILREKAMNRPRHGLCLPCVYRHCRDGNTVVISWRGSTREWAIRLINCWAPGLDTHAGCDAFAFAKSIMEDADAGGDLHVYIPASGEVENLLRGVVSLGWIFVNTETTLNEMMVLAGHATESKPKER